MINYSNYNLFQMIFAWEGSTTKATYVEVLVASFMCVLANLIIKINDGQTDFFKLWWWSKEGHVLSLFPLAFLVVFRTGMAHNRYFEGRGHVGKMVHATRELARGLSTYVKGDDPGTQRNRADCARLVKAYTVALRLSLRKIEDTTEGKEELKQYLTETEYEKIKAVKKNFVLIILQWLGDSVGVFKSQLLFDRAIDFMENDVSTMMEAWMGMHKLATTPMPFPFVQMLYSLLYGWAFTLGFPMAEEYGWKGLIVVILVSYALFSINAIGKELEDPFGEETNDLDLPFFEKAANTACKIMLPKMLEPSQKEPPGGGAMNGHAVKAVVQTTSANPLTASPTSPGATSPGGTDVQAVLTDPDLGARVKSEVASANEINDLTPELRSVFKQYFNRYDLNGNGILDTNKELTQLVTNLAFALKLGNGLSQLLEAVDAQGENLHWDTSQFVAWFLKQAKSVPL